MQYLREIKSRNMYKCFAAHRYYVHAYKEKEREEHTWKVGSRMMPTTTLNMHEIEHLHASHQHGYGYEFGFTFFACVCCCSSAFSLIWSSQSYNFDFISFSQNRTIHICSQHPTLSSMIIMPNQHYNGSMHSENSEIRTAISSCLRSCMQQNYQLEMHFNCQIQIV